MNPVQIQSLRNLFGHRIASMLEDGYMVQSMSDMSNYVFYKLIHHRNGNVVTFHIYPPADRMIQKHGDTIVYDGPITG